ncbi:MAG: peptide deformylase [Proteobacteria bacterium]|nr:peptide deformylase [Pseudomonadota bacterium]
MILDILTYPNSELQKTSKPVQKFDKTLHTLLNNMADTMYDAEGIGLAAPQVGQKIRVFVIDITTEEDEEKKLYEFINPKLSQGTGSITFEEGCLSVPGFTEEVKRKEQIKVNYRDRFGRAKTIAAEGLLAVAIQHENDHLDGILFIEKLSILKRRMAKKKLANRPLS